MAKGALAKENVIARLREAFGEDFVGVVDKKVYVYADEFYIDQVVTNYFTNAMKHAEERDGKKPVKSEQTYKIL